MSNGSASGNRLISRLCSSFRFFPHLLTSLVVAAICAGAPSAARAEMAELSDAELETVTGGDYEMVLEGFDILIGENEAGNFTMDIAQGAFDSAQGLFTTLMAVNSAVDLSVVVNIYVDAASAGGSI